MRPVPRRRERRAGLKSKWMMLMSETRSVERAVPGDAADILGLIRRRIAWMDERGIHQWNEDAYLEVFPHAYFVRAADEGRLYVVRQGGELAGAFTLFETDARWEDRMPALYVHNLVSHPGRRGAGRAALRFCEEEARRRGVGRLRLDCIASNRELNAFYDTLGFRFAGTCAVGWYRGTLREKRL